jgi:hypothetical protein
VSGENTNKVLALLRNELLRLARLEDSLATSQAESVPYWAPCPATVQGHRMAAVALRAHADALGAGVELEAPALPARDVSGSAR